MKTITHFLKLSSLPCFASLLLLCGSASLVAQEGGDFPLTAYGAGNAQEVEDSPLYTAYGAGNMNGLTLNNSSGVIPNNGANKDVYINDGMLVPWKDAFLADINKLSEENDYGFKGLPFLNVKISSADFSAIEQRYVSRYNNPEGNVLAWQANNDGTHMDVAGYVGIGLGSFIWYGDKNHENYVEDWPAVAQALQSHGVTLPAWALGACPWSTEAEFTAANTPGSPYYDEIQTLNQTLQTDPVALDIQFRFGPWARLLRGVTPWSDTPADYMFGYDPVKSPNAIISLAPGEAELVGANFSAVAAVKDEAGHPLGLYALMDYDNFKGEGTSVTEIHNTQHWGELSVLKNMGALDQQQQDPLTSFINSGLDILHARIVNTEMEADRNNTPVPNQNYNSTSDPIKYWTFFENHLRDYSNWPATEANQ